ncbi:uncharacterized protein LOC143290564 isoform X2 [Babylonia areolata]|uniref:uncharacterized protein LOC143290564 isoform X2 n=1 Tax=Babylonia areolata TaxID=304850 RepID=UPI003FD407EF
MVVPAGGAWLALHVLLPLWMVMLMMTLLPPLSQPRLVSAAVTSPSSWSGHVSDSVTAYVSSGKQDQQQEQQQEQEQADMPAARQYYRGQEDIQVGCRELRAKRYISDGFCTSTKPIKEVVCAGNCLPIRNLPWYAEFVKVWAKSKLREWQCEEDIVRRKTVSLLCRNGDYRTYRIKVVKSCKCKRIVSKHNRTVSGEGKRKKKNKKKRKKDRRRRGKKSRKGAKRSRKAEEKEEKEEEEEEIDVSQMDQRQGGGRQAKERRDRKRNRKRSEEKGDERNSEPVSGGVPAEDKDSVASSADSERHKALAAPSR